MNRRLIFSAVLLALLGTGLGTGLVGSASAASHTVCVEDPNPHNAAWCVSWDDPKP